jgi:hypothetical protein
MTNDSTGMTVCLLSSYVALVYPGRPGNMSHLMTNYHDVLLCL